MGDVEPSPQRVELIVEGAEVAQELGAAHRSGRVQQSRLEHEERDHLAVGRGGGSPRRVVVETEVPPEPHHTRPRVDLIHRPSMNRHHWQPPLDRMSPPIAG